MTAAEVEEIELVPDNASFPRRRMTAADGDLRVVAELLEIVA